MTALSVEAAQIVSDAERWNSWAATINQKALAAGLVTAETLEANRRRCQEATALLVRKELAQ